MTDLSHKKTVKELRSILRDHKKTHCKPYSKLNKAEMIKLIKSYGLSEKIDITISQPKPNNTKVSNHKTMKPVLRLRISRCRTVLPHSHSRGFKPAKTTCTIKLLQC